MFTALGAFAVDAGCGVDAGIEVFKIFAIGFVVAWCTFPNLLVMPPAMRQLALVLDFAEKRMKKTRNGFIVAYTLQICMICR